MPSDVTPAERAELKRLSKEAMAEFAGRFHTAGTTYSVSGPKKNVWTHALPGMQSGQMVASDCPAELAELFASLDPATVLRLLAGYAAAEAKMQVYRDNYYGTCGVCATACCDMLTNDYCAVCRLDKMRERAERAESEMARSMPGWRPIESAPKTRRSLLVWCPGNLCTYLVYWRDFGTEPCWWLFGTSGTGKLDIEPTHWQPLPEAPR